MKYPKVIAIILAVALMLAACGATPEQTQPSGTEATLHDGEFRVNGELVGSDPGSAVYTATDIVYYEAGKDFTYGEGTEADAHSAQEAAEHTVIHISQPGTYSLSGKLSKGQIAVDLGDGAKEDPNAVVTLILDGVDITCEVAPAIIFYNVYECGDTENATKDVDTSAAGANVVIADGSENTVKGAYVAKIYKPESVVLNEAGTEVEDAKKLHKYDGALYSKVSMNVSGGKENTGTLNIYAENEGLDSELHLTIHGGNINIFSGNDGINTNEDGISVTTVNGGKLSIRVDGKTGEGDGIDSNGWLVINGGTVIAEACSDSADAGIDSDMGIHINGGTVIASGHMLDRIEDGGQTYAVFSFAKKQSGAQTVTLKQEDGKALLEVAPQNAYSVLIYSSPDLKAGSYTLWSGEQQLAAQGGMSGGPGEMTPPAGQENQMQPTPPDGEKPSEGMTPPEKPDKQEGGTPPEGFTPPEGGMFPGSQNDNRPGANNMGTQEATKDFAIRDGGNMFGNVS